MFPDCDVFGSWKFEKSATPNNEAIDQRREYQRARSQQYCILRFTTAANRSLPHKSP